MKDWLIGLAFIGIFGGGFLVIMYICYLYLFGGI